MNIHTLGDLIMKFKKNPYTYHKLDVRADIGYTNPSNIPYPFTVDDIELNPGRQPKESPLKEWWKEQEAKRIAEQQNK